MPVNSATDEVSGLTDPPEGVTPITVEDARVFYTEYHATAETPELPLKGFTIDRAQFEAMQMLIRGNPDLAGFRVIIGRDRLGNNLGMVVGIDEYNADVVRSGIYQTSSRVAGPCPPMCDRSSPITRD